jgi:hypothetical protein
MTDANEFWPLPYPDQLGPNIGADDIRDAVKATILEWSSYYLSILSSRLAAAGSIGSSGQNDNPLPDFGEWVNAPEYRTYGTGKPACFLVTVNQTVGEPQLQGKRQYIATWRAQVLVQVFGSSWEDAADLVSWYDKVARWCILQHRSLGGLAMSTKWAGVQYRGTEHESTRTVAQAIQGYDVQVANVIDVARGPATVPLLPEPPPFDPTVESTVVTITNGPANEPVPQP